MSVNKYKDHCFIIPEDDAVRQIATGFQLGVKNDRNLQVLPEAGGWLNVCSKFLREHVQGLRSYPLRNIVLAIDFDNKLAEKREFIIQQIPKDIQPRVFLLGTLDEPEDLKKLISMNYEDIGRKLARECEDEFYDLWNHDHLKHNHLEVLRLNSQVRDFLF